MADTKLELKPWAGVVTSAKQIPLGRLMAILLVVGQLDTWLHLAKRKKYFLSAISTLVLL